MSGPWGEIDAVLLPGLGSLLPGLISFIAIIALSSVLAALWRPVLRPLFAGLLLPLLEFVDWLVVQGGSFLVGTRIQRTAPRWSVLIVVLLTLGLLGAFLPDQLGYGALLLGVLAILIVFRHWSWDEDEVENEVPESEKRIKIVGDLRNEMLISVAFLFLYGPIAFARLQADGYGFSPAPGAGVLAFVKFTYLELAKAIPLIDYYEIFSEELRFERFSDVGRPSLVAKFLTLALRASFDLVLIASLLRLPAIAKRAREGRDLRPIEEVLLSNDVARQLEGVKQLKVFALRRRLRARERLVEITRQRAIGDLFRYGVKVRFLAVNAVRAIGAQLGDDGALFASIAGYREILREWTRQSAPLDWAQTQNNLGIALDDLGTLRADQSLLEEAVVAYREALKERTRERTPLAWAITQMNLGATIEQLGTVRGDTALIEEAITAYREALTALSLEGSPLTWGTTKNNLGIALRQLSFLRGDPKLLEEAIVAYREALKGRTRARAPLDWAATQNNLGGALLQHGKLRRDVKLLKEAVAACREALKEYTQERAPLSWARTQNNLGGALLEIGGVLAKPAFIGGAVTAFREALKERTQERTPLEWAQTQNNLGVALQYLGSIRKDAGLLQEAVSAFREALKERTRERSPLEWAATQNNLGIALRHLAALRRDEALAEEAIAAFREALKERSRERAPLDWAQTRYNLGNALSQLGAVRGDATLFEEAIQAFRDAIEIFEQRGAVELAKQARDSLRRAEEVVRALRSGQSTKVSSPPHKEHHNLSDMCFGCTSEPGCASVRWGLGPSAEMRFAS